MSAVPSAVKVPAQAANQSASNSPQAIKEQLSSELFFAMVGPVGSGCSVVASEMEKALTKKDYKVFYIKASDLIREWAQENSIPCVQITPAGGQRQLGDQGAMQDLGDKMRSFYGDNAAAAIRAIQRIRKCRAAAMNVSADDGQPVKPDSVKRAYIIDSLKQPAEVELLRSIYRGSFALVGVVCEMEVRRNRLRDLFFTKDQQKHKDNLDQIDAFMERDSLDPEKDSGQKVTDTFHQSDYFIDNSQANDLTKIDAVDTANDQISRLISLLTQTGIERPKLEEAAMHAAASAQKASACLSRQVGSALVDAQGDIVSTGSNEVPRAGGGTYAKELWHGKDRPNEDFRCAFHPDGQHCRSTKTINSLLEEASGALERHIVAPDFSTILRDNLTGELEVDEATFEKILKGLKKSIENEGRRKAYKNTLKKTRVGSLIEFSRAVHAEMDAILSAARAGAGSTPFSRTVW